MKYIERNVQKKRKYQSSETKSVREAAKEFLEKAARELLGESLKKRIRTLKPLSTIFTTMNFQSSSSSQQQNPLTTIMNNIFTSLTTHLNTHLPNFTNSSPLPFAKITHLPPKPPTTSTTTSSNRSSSNNVAMSSETIEERLAGVPVYALSNSNEEFVLVSGACSRKSLGLFCFRKEDADSLLDQMKSIDPNMRVGSNVVPVALNKVFQLKVKGVAFRLIPETSQVKNALKEKERGGNSQEGFVGVPVFQSRSLSLRANNKTYRPVFFRKEDLENSLFRASKQQRKLNPVFRQGDIEVAVLEEIIRGMKDESCTKWDDVVFIPPGFDVSTHPSPSQES